MYRKGNIIYFKDPRKKKKPIGEDYLNFLKAMSNNKKPIKNLGRSE